jgi:hypothetical protein
MFKLKGAGFVQGKINSNFIDMDLNNQGRTVFQGDMNIHMLKVKGKGLVEINGIHSADLVLKLSGKPHIKLAGVMNLTEIDVKGAPTVSMYWLKGEYLKVRGHDKARMQLGGAVDLLDVELWGNSYFNGRFLRANRAFVETHGSALAEINVVKRQHTLAHDASDIHFYHLHICADANNPEYKLGRYNAVAPLATGYLDIEVGGVVYKVLAST